MLRKFRLIGEALAALGLPLVDEEVMRLAEDYVARL